MGQRDYVTIHHTSIPALRLAQVDLGALFTRGTRETLQTSSIEREFWITPPLSAWPYPEPRAFKSYSMPFLEFRRRMAPLRQQGANGTVVYTRRIVKPRLAMPWLRSFAGLFAVQQEDIVLEKMTYDLSLGGDEDLEQPLPQWLASLARFRTFDTEYSPCRH